MAQAAGRLLIPRRGKCGAVENLGEASAVDHAERVGDRGTQISCSDSRRTRVSFVYADT